MIVVFKFNIKESNFFIVFDYACIYLTTSQYDNTLFSFTLFPRLT